MAGPGPELCGVTQTQPGGGGRRIYLLLLTPTLSGFNCMAPRPGVLHGKNTELVPAEAEAVEQEAGEVWRA